jgi:hypothetical protein
LSSLKGQCYAIFGPLVVVLLFIFGEKVDRRGKREERDNGWKIF